MSSIGSGGSTSWQASFYQAAGKGDEPRVRELVKEGIVHGDKYKEALRIALQRVAGRGHEPLTRLLLEEGAEVNAASDNEVSAIYKAAELGKDKVVKLLLDYGTDKETRDKFKRTAIFPAAQRNHRKTLSLLLNAGANVNAKDGDGRNVMLFLASERSEKTAKWGEEIIRILLETDIDLEAKDKEGRTSLLWSAATGKEMLAKLLLTGRVRNNADIQATNNRGKTALHLAAENHHEKNRDALVELLLDHRAKPNTRSDGEWTALHNAADKGYKNVAALLLRRSADVNATTSSGMSPLHWAARNGHVELVELLLQQKDIRKNLKDSNDQTPMLGAAENGFIDIVKMLSPADDGRLLSVTAQGACKGFQATIVDFGMENRPINHTKTSVFDLLYGWDEKMDKPHVSTLIRNVPAKPTFRWIHLPANNMAWVEALLTKQFVENSASDVQGFKALEKSFSQLHRGPTVHSHFMRPLCRRMPPTARDPPASDLSESATEKSGNEAELPVIVTPKADNVPVLAAQAPETQGRQGERKRKKSKKSSENTSTGSTPMKTSNSPRADLKPPGRRDNRHTERNRTPLGRNSRDKERNGNVMLFMPYLHYETHQQRKRMSMAIEQAEETPDRVCGPNAGFTCDEMLIQAYLPGTHNLHIRRTLDQYYYHAISTKDRDIDQVVYRYTQEYGRDNGKDKKVYMVDQLWLWILDKDLIVTAFPQRWEQPKPDPLNILDGIIEDMSSKTRPPVKSVYDLATLITGRCSGLFDRHRLGDEEYQFLDMFESSIGEVTNKETKLFKKFNDASKDAARWLTNQRQRGKAQMIDIPSAVNPDRNDLNFVDTLLNIREETALLAETKDIRDELNMISMALKSQTSILQDLLKALLEELEGKHNQQKQADVRKRFHEQLKVIDVYLKDVDRMDRQAEGIYTSLTHLLDLKQKHANAFEARFARDQAAFTGRQGQTIMVFTIVTIVFLPMSFIAAFFAIPVKEFAHENGAPSLPLSYVAKIMFGIGFAISIPLVALAFALDNVGLLIKRAFKSLVSWTRKPRRNLDRRSRSRSPTLTEKKDMEDLRRRRRSGESYRRGSRRSGYETDSDVELSPIRTATHRKKDEPEWRKRMSGGSKDLERGINGVS